MDPLTGDQPLSPELLDRLNGVSERYRAMALRFSCNERTRIVTYGDGGPARERVVVGDYLLGGRTAGSGLAEYRAESRSSADAPPPLAWSLLFGDRERPYFSYSDFGESAAGFRLVRTIGFRGAVASGDPSDIRVWEGLLVVDATTLLPHEVVAVPRNQDAKLAEKFRQRQRKLRVKLGVAVGDQVDPLWAGRAAKTVVGKHIRVKFEPAHGGLVFPRLAETRTFEVVHVGAYADRRRAIREYDQYRFYDVETTTRFPD